MDDSQLEIPTHCKAGVVVNEGPNFHLEVQMVPVPEPGKILTFDGNSNLFNDTDFHTF